MKKISVLLVMLIVSFTAAFAYDVEVDGLYYNLIKGNNAELVAGDVKYSGDVVIPPAITVNGVQYKVAIIAGAFNKCDGLTSVVVPETVTDLGNDAFRDCTNLTSFVIPSGVTTIGDYALSNTGCTEFIVPSNVTKIGFATFGHSKKLETFTFNASMKELPAAMCYECKSLKTVRICEGVEGYFGDIYSPFRFCESLQNVLLPQSLKNVGTSMFEGCSALEEINLPNNVTNIDFYAFWNCTSLKNVNCPEKLETIKRMGFRNTAIEAFTCSNTIKTIGEGAFTECKKLKSISLGVSIQRIDGTAFANCPNLENVYCRAEKVPNTNASAFDNSYPNYCNLYVPQASVGLYSTTSPWSSFGTIASIEDIEPPVCATPTITIENGRLSFVCETPGAECHYTVAPASSTTEGTGMTNILIPFAEVRVYAVAPGYAKSETATKVLTITDLLSSATPGDVNGDTQVTISDVTKLVDILLEKKD